MLRRSLRAAVPSVAVVLSMSTLTVIILVLVVTTVARAAPLSQSDSWQSTAWSRWNATPDVSIGVQETLYADFEPFDEMALTRDYGDTDGVAWQMPGQ